MLVTSGPAAAIPRITKRALRFTIAVSSCVLGFALLLDASAHHFDGTGRSRGAQPSHGSNSVKKKLLGSATSDPLRFGGIGTDPPPSVRIASPAPLTALTS